MPDQNTGPLDISMNLSGTKTAVPMIAEGHFATFRLVGLTQQNSEKGPMLKWEYDLVNPAPNSEGGTIEPGKMGAKFFENVALFDKNTPAGTWPEWAQKRVCQRIDALLGTGDKGNAKGKPERPDLNSALVPTLIGKTLVGKMKVRSGDYVGNEFSNVFFPGDISA